MRRRAPPLTVPRGLTQEPSIAEFLAHGYAPYLDLVRSVERHPDNRDGADKSWVERAMRDYQQHYRKVVRG